MQQKSHTIEGQLNIPKEFILGHTIETGTQTLP